MEYHPKLKLLDLYLQYEVPSDLEGLCAGAGEFAEFVQAQKAVSKSFVNKLERLKNFSKFVAKMDGPDLLSQVRQTVWGEIDRVIDAAVEQATKEQRKFEKAHNFKMGHDSISVTTTTTTKEG